MSARFPIFIFLVGLSPLHLIAMEPPKLLDPALKLEALCTVPDIESPTTVVGAPDGSFYVGCDLRDGGLNTDKPECYIVRYSSMSADKKRTVFADKIFSPAGSAWHDGWLYVAHDPFLTRFKDTDGDGIADVREDLITNLGKRPDTGLNDHLASGFTLGMDGFFYMSIGDRGTYQTRSVKDGSTISLQGGGIIRFRPDGTALEIFSSGTRNHLAVLLDAEDNAFTLDNTDDGNGWWTRLTHHIEGGYYGYPYDYQKAENFGVARPSKETLDAAAKVFSIQKPVFSGKTGGAVSPLNTEHWPLNTLFLPALTDFGPGSPTGGLCYLSDGLPEQYRGKLLFSEWGKGGLFVIEVARDGATFRFVKNTPLIQGGNGIDFRPMQLSVAADGSLLIADWQWDGAKGSKTVGTIWRLSWPEARPAPRLKDEGKATVEELLAALAHPDRDQRLRAQGRLVDRAQLAHLSINNPQNPALEKKIEELATRMRKLVETNPNGKEMKKLRGMIEAFRGVGGSSSVDLNAFLGADLVEELRRAKNEAERTFGAVRNGVRLAATQPDGSLLQRHHALWTEAAIGRCQFLDYDVFSPLMKEWASNLIVPLAADAAPPIRAQATRALGASWSGSNAHLSQPHKATVDRLDDLDAAVRLQTIIALGRANGELVVSASMQYLLKDPDPWVQFAVVNALRKHKVWAENQTWPKGSALEGSDESFVEKVWWTLGGVYDARLINVFASVATKPLPFDRTRALTALARIAYQPKPWDGHWWGTQPVKNPPPLNSVAWEGTPAALQALTAALSDPDPAVRLAAAKAFTLFVMPPPAPAAPPAASAAPFSDPSSAPSTPVAAFFHPCWRLSPSLSSAFCTLSATDSPQKAADSPEKGTDSLFGAADISEKAAAQGQKGATVAQAVVAAAQSAATPPAQAPASDLEAASAARKALRDRLTAETDPAVRRALIEALGAQKDSGAMKVFMEIALDEKADAEFRDAAMRACALATNADGAWVNRGDARRGEKLFFDPTAALGGICATCHKVRGLGKEVGPDLSLVGSIYKRADLIVSILEPSKTIAFGFEQNMIETNGGETFTGALRQETGEAFTLVGADGVRHVIKKTDVKTRKPIELSLMPPSLTLALKPADFTDLLAFLEALK